MKSTREQMKFTKEEKVTGVSHFKRSNEDHIKIRKKENAKVSGICEQLTDEDYEREKAEITVHLELLMELLQKNVKDQTHGWTMRKKVKWQRLHAKREKQVNIQLIEELRKLEQMFGCEELREAELKMDVSICGPEQGEILGEEINEEDLMNYWDSLEEYEDVLVKEANEAMKPCIFKSHNLCMFVGCAKDGGQSHENVTEKNETLEVKSNGKILSDKEGTDLLQQEEIMNEVLFGVRQQVEAIMEQKHSGNAEEIF